MSPAVLSDRLELFEGQEDFLVVVAGIVFGFDVDGADLAAVLARLRSAARHEVGVVEAEPRRARGEGDPPHPVRRDVGGAFFG